MPCWQEGKVDRAARRQRGLTVNTPSARRSRRLHAQRRVNVLVVDLVLVAQQMVVNAKGKEAVFPTRVGDDTSDGNTLVIQRLIRVTREHVRSKQRLRRARDSDRLKKVTAKKAV